MSEPESLFVGEDEVPKARRRDPFEQFSSPPESGDEQAGEHDDDDGNERNYCVCHGEEAGFMIFCEAGCNNWFHGRCVGIKKEEEANLLMYSCPNCSKQGKSETVWKDNKLRAQYVKRFKSDRSTARSATAADPHQASSSQDRRQAFLDKQAAERRQYDAEAVNDPMMLMQQSLIFPKPSTSVALPGILHHGIDKSNKSSSIVGGGGGGGGDGIHGSSGAASSALTRKRLFANKHKAEKDVEEERILHGGQARGKETGNADDDSSLGKGHKEPDLEQKFAYQIVKNAMMDDLFRKRG